METAIQGSGVEPSETRISVLRGVPRMVLISIALLVGCAGLALIMIGCGVVIVGQRAANLARRAFRVPERPEFDPEAEIRARAREANR